MGPTILLIGFIGFTFLFLVNKSNKTKNINRLLESGNDLPFLSEADNAKLGIQSSYNLRPGSSLIPRKESKSEGWMVAIMELLKHIPFGEVLKSLLNMFTTSDESVKKIKRADGTPSDISDIEDLLDFTSLDPFIQTMANIPTNFLSVADNPYKLFSKAPSSQNDAPIIDAVVRFFENPTNGKFTKLYSVSNYTGPLPFPFLYVNQTDYDWIGRDGTDPERCLMAAKVCELHPTLYGWCVNLLLNRFKGWDRNTDLNGGSLVKYYFNKWLQANPNTPLFKTGEFSGISVPLNDRRAYYLPNAYPSVEKGDYLSAESPKISTKDLRDSTNELVSQAYKSDSTILSNSEKDLEYMRLARTNALRKKLGKELLTGEPDADATILGREVIPLENVEG